MHLLLTSSFMHIRNVDLISLGRAICFQNQKAISSHPVLLIFLFLPVTTLKEKRNEEKKSKNKKRKTRKKLSSMWLKVNWRRQASRKFAKQIWVAKEILYSFFTHDMTIFSFMLNITWFKSALSLAMYLPFPVKDEENNMDMIGEILWKSQYHESTV